MCLISEDSQKPHLDEVMDLTDNMRENSDRAMSEPKPKSAGVHKIQSPIQPKLPGNRGHGVTASSSGPGLTNQPKARPNQRGVSLQRPTTSSQPVKLDIDSDLPIILVPSFHSRAEIVLENFSQMFVNGR